MSAPGERLEQALLAFRRELTLGYLRELSQGEPVPARARAFLCSAEAIELVYQAARGGELTESAHAAWCAHLARAQAESEYAVARAASLRLPEQLVSVEGDMRRFGAVLSDWLRERSAARRARLLDAACPPLSRHVSALMDARAQADAAAAKVLAGLSGPRHPDAGPEGGVSSVAERWLATTADLASEAFRCIRELTGAQGSSGLDTLWAALGRELTGLVPRAGRYRRLAAELEPLDLRRLLASHARLGPEHPQLFSAPQVSLVVAARDVRVVPALHELGLASELLAADALGRAAAFVHASPALPLPLRHPSAATVARAAGGLSMLRFTEPLFLRKRRELNAREAGEVARRAAAVVLLEIRLCAAAVLARGLRGQDAEASAHALCERALMGPVPPAIAAFLLTRLSASSAFRGKSWAPALGYALREQFDEDWFLNPHAGEPLRGAFARAGELSVEAFADELGAKIDLGPSKLSELF